MKDTIKVIAFDADDTLWINEIYFQKAEETFCNLFTPTYSKELVSKALLDVELKNLHLYGYGVKGFILCMLETATVISKERVSSQIVEQIIAIGHCLLEKPIELLQGVEQTLTDLKGKYTLILATKGDLLDQQRKLKNSGLEKYFDHIAIMSEKKAPDYQKLLKDLNCKSEEFLMLGNSLKSDILPVLEIGGHGIHIPYQVTWAYEQHHDPIIHNQFLELNQINQVLEYLK